MAPGTIKRALGAVKDQTSIGIAKVAKSTFLSDLDVAILKATRHEEYPSEEKYIKEIFSLTCYSRSFISACVNTLAKRLNKTRNWIVALKTLVLIQRLLSEGDPAYEQEIFFATRRGTRLLNLSDFRDKSISRSWDYSSFVRTYALYLDERLEYRMQNRRGKRSRFGFGIDEEDECKDKEKDTIKDKEVSSSVREMKVDRVISRAQHLQMLLERFLACRPTGDARNHRIVIVALCPIVKESFQIYDDITETVAILVERFSNLEITACVKVYDMFCRLAKQLEELDMFYCCCKKIGVRRGSEYPEIDEITQKQLEVLDSYIKGKSEETRRNKAVEDADNEGDEEEKEEEPKGEDMNLMKALPAPEEFTEEPAEEVEEEEEQKEEPNAEKVTQEFGDLLKLLDDAPSTEEHVDNMALALFDGAAAANGTPEPAPAWEAFKATDWETALVQSTSCLPYQKTSLGGGFDMMLLNGLYQQSETAAGMAGPGFGTTGSESSIALGASGRPAMLALPAPPTSSGTSTSSSSCTSDPFAASVSVAPPPYVQMSDMQMKQKLLVGEQLVWQQYARDGMQGHIASSRPQQNPFMGGYP